MIAGLSARRSADPSAQRERVEAPILSALRAPRISDPCASQLPHGALQVAHGVRVIFQSSSQTYCSPTVLPDRLACGGYTPDRGITPVSANRDRNGTAEYGDTTIVATCIPSDGSAFQRRRFVGGIDLLGGVGLDFRLARGNGKLIDGQAVGSGAVALRAAPATSSNRTAPNKLIEIHRAPPPAIVVPRHRSTTPWQHRVSRLPCASSSTALARGPVSLGSRFAGVG